MNKIYAKIMLILICILSCFFTNINAALAGDLYGRVLTRGSWEQELWPGTSSEPYPASNLQVSLNTCNEGYASCVFEEQTYTGSDGSYFFLNLIDGFYMIEANHEIRTIRLDDSSSRQAPDIIIP